jgi:hypothetical protein
VKSQFLGGSYRLRSLPLSAQTCINLYAEGNGSGVGGEVGAFYGTPGKRLLFNVGATGEGRGMYVAGGNLSDLYVVVGSGVYHVNLFPTQNNPWSVNLVGNLPNSAGRVSMIANTTQLLISHQNGFHLATLANDAAGLSPVSNAPVSGVAGGPPILAYQDGFGIFVSNIGLGQVFGITALNDFSSINPLDEATAEALPDYLTSAVSTEREVWLLGLDTAEIWSDTGAASFPFERIPGGVLQVGCAAPFSVSYIDGSVYWLTSSSTGNFRVVRTVGYQTQYISTPAIESQLQSLSGPDNIDPIFVAAWAYAYQSGGHTFYVLNLPRAGITLAYDASTGLWHQRAYRDSNGVLHADLAAAYAFFAAPGAPNLTGHLLLDPMNGNVYQMDDATYTDNSSPIYRERAWPIVGPEELNRIRVDNIALDCESGVGNQTGTDTDPQVCLEMSYDGGKTFGVSRYQSMGKVGKYQSVPTWKRNGVGRRPVARLSTTAQTKIAWLGANVDGEVLTR